MATDIARVEVLAIVDRWRFLTRRGRGTRQGASPRRRLRQAVRACACSPAASTPRARRRCSARFSLARRDNRLRVAKRGRPIVGPKASGCSPPGGGDVRGRCRRPPRGLPRTGVCPSQHSSSSASQFISARGPSHLRRHGMANQEEGLGFVTRDPERAWEELVESAPALRTASRSSPHVEGAPHGGTAGKSGSRNHAPRYTNAFSGSQLPHFPAPATAPPAVTKRRTTIQSPIGDQSNVPHRAWGTPLHASNDAASS